MEEPTPFSVLINWTPFLVWLGFTIYIAFAFGRYARARSSYQSEIVKHLERQSQAMERIAAEISKRPD